MKLTVVNQTPPHAPGGFQAVCVDVIDLGVHERMYEGKKRHVPLVRLVFETVGDDDRRDFIGRTFSASLHQKSRLHEFLSKWRGRELMPGETFEMNVLKNKTCTLIVANAPSRKTGETICFIESISRA